MAHLAKCLPMMAQPAQEGLGQATKGRIHASVDSLWIAWHNARARDMCMGASECGQVLPVLERKRESKYNYTL